jgi:hypothetical protein
MQINLRKAQKLRKGIEGVLATMSLNTTISIDVDDAAVAGDPAARIDAGRNELLAQYKNLFALSGALARIRIAIAKANQEAGIDEILAKSAEIDRHIKIVGSISHASRDSIESITTKIKRAQTNLSRDDEPRASHRGASSSLLTFNIVDQKMADEAIASTADLRRAKEELEDRRLAANSSTTIKIGEADVIVLRDMKII